MGIFNVPGGGEEADPRRTPRWFFQPRQASGALRETERRGARGDRVATSSRAAPRDRDASRETVKTGIAATSGPASRFGVGLHNAGRSMVDAMLVVATRTRAIVVIGHRTDLCRAAAEAWPSSVSNGRTNRLLYDVVDLLTLMPYCASRSW